MPYIDDVLTMLDANLAEEKHTLRKIVANFSNEDLFEKAAIIANCLQITCHIGKAGEIKEFIRDELPLLYEWEEFDTAEGLTYGLYLTDFAVQNPEIAICEVILFFHSLKVKLNGIDLPDEILQVEEQYRSFLAVYAIYSGFGLFFLERVWITGRYQFSDEPNAFSLKYYFPFNTDGLIYGTALSVALDDENEQDLNPPSGIPFSKEISKELKICKNYIEKNNIVSRLRNRFSLK